MPLISSEYAKLMAERIARLRKQAKGLIEYKPPGEEGKLSEGLVEKIVEKGKLPSVAGATTAGALMAGEVQARPKIPPKEPLGEETVDIQIPPGQEEQAKGRLEQLMKQGGLAEADALKQLKWELEPQNRVAAEPTDPSKAWDNFNTTMATVNKSPADAWTSFEASAIEKDKTTNVGAAWDKFAATGQATAGQLTPTTEEGGTTAGDVGKVAARFAYDIGVFSASLATATALVASSGVTVPALGTVALGASIYAGVRQLQNYLEGKPPTEGTLSESAINISKDILHSVGILKEQYPDVKLPPEVQAAVSVAEDIAIIGGGREAFRLIKKAVVSGVVNPVKVVGGGTGKVLKGVDYVLGRPIEKITEPLRPVGEWLMDNVVVKPFQVQIPGLEKSAQEIFQSGVERLAKSKILKERMAAGTIRRAAVQKSLVTDAGRSLSREMEGLLPSEQYDVLKGLRGTPHGELKSSKAVDVLQRFESRIDQADINFLYENKFKESLSKGLTKSIEDIEGKFDPISIRGFLDMFETKLPTEHGRFFKKAGPSISNIHNMMRDIIDHPHVSDEMKTFVKDMWSAPYHTAREVASASREASTFYMTDKLIANRGIVSSIQKPDYVLSKWGKFAGQYVPRDVELQLQDYSKVPKLAEGMYMKWFLSPWKISKTIARPAYHVRNLMSNLILNDWGGLPFYRIDVYRDALRGMRNNSPEWLKFKQLTGGGASFVQNDLYQLESGMKYGATMFDKIHNVFTRAVQPAASLQNAEENLFKFGKYIHNISERGMKPVEAALDAQKYLFNFGEVTTGTAYLRKYGMPFATWYTKSLPLMVETAVKHPLRFGKWLAFGAALQSYALDAVGITDGEWDTIEKQLPNYIQKGIYLLMPWRDEKNRLNMLNMTYILPGIGDVNELYNLFSAGGGSGAFRVPNPLISIAGDIAAKKKFSGAPLYYDWEPGSTKFMKTMSYVWEQMSPAIVPGGTDWNLMWRAITEQEGAPTPEEALGSWFGFKLSPVDHEANVRRNEAIRKIYDAEISLQMKKELRDATTGEQTEGVLRKYQSIREGAANP